jgi:DNA polymerase III epsilon subunit-like protein
MLDHLLVIDFETTGLDPRIRKHQPISAGAIVIERKTLVSVEEIYLECAFDETQFEWTQSAERIHGLSIDYLSSKPSMQDAATELLRLLVKYWNQGDAITLVGHNPHFDSKCFNIWMDSIDVKVRQSHRKLDTFSVGFAVFGAETSDDFFKHVGVVRNSHNALEDAKATVEGIRLARKVGTIYQKLIQEKSG